MFKSKQRLTGHTHGKQLFYPLDPSIYVAVPSQTKLRKKKKSVLTHVFVGIIHLSPAEKSSVVSRDECRSFFLQQLCSTYTLWTHTCSAACRPIVSKNSAATMYGEDRLHQTNVLNHFFLAYFMSIAIVVVVHCSLDFRLEFSEIEVTALLQPIYVVI